MPETTMHGPDASGDEDRDVLLFSRTGIDNPMGKLGDPIKTDVDFDTGAAFRKMTNEAGTTTAGLLRDFIYLQVHGKTFSDMVNDAAKVKRDRFFGTGRDWSVLGVPQ
jgi:hypothetical protein